MVSELDAQHSTRADVLKQRLSLQAFDFEEESAYNRTLTQSRGIVNSATPRIM
jgi:hypothetical protein